MLYYLYEENFITMFKNKGYFRYAEEHFVDFDGTPYKKNSLINIKLKILWNMKDYVYVCKEVEKIISKCRA
jgi:hypothetical protein